MSFRRFRFLATACALALGLATASHVRAAGTVLHPGDIAVIGMNCSVDDLVHCRQRWAIVVLTELAVGTEVNFSTEGCGADGKLQLSERVGPLYMTWETNRIVPAGTVLASNTAWGENDSVDLNGSASGDGGMDDYGSVDGRIGAFFQGPTNGSVIPFSVDGDQIIVFQGSIEQPRYLFALNTGSSPGGRGTWTTSGNVYYYNSYRPPGLIDGVTALALTNVGSTSYGSGAVGTPNYAFQNMVYKGGVSGTREELLAAIGNPSCWAGHDSVPFPIGMGAGFCFPSAFTVRPPTVDMAPSMVATEANPGFSEGGPAVVLFKAVSARTNNSGQRFTGFSVLVSGVVNGASELLRVNDVDIPLVQGSQGSISGLGSYAVQLLPGGAYVQFSGMALISGALNAAVSGMTYRNTAAGLIDGTRTVLVVNLQDDGATNNSVNPSLRSVVTVSPNRAPSLAATAVNPTFGSATANADLFSGVTASTNNYGQVFTDLVFTVWNVVNGANEVITIGGVDVPMQAGSGPIAGDGTFTVSALGGLWKVQLSGMALTDAEMGALVDGLSYRNAAVAPTPGNRTLILGSISDNGAAANGATLSLASQVHVVANHAPVLAPCNSALTPIQATDVANSGQTVTSIVGTSIADADSGARRGIALAQFFFDYASWQFSTDAGVTWTGFLAAPGDPQVGLLLLRAEDRVRYVPDGRYGGSASLVYLAWDQTGTTAGMQGRWFDVSGFAPFGGTTPFSTEPDFATLTILGITPGSFQDWLVSNFTAAEQQQQKYASPSGDPAGCGVTNLMRYALNLPTRGPVTVPTKLVTQTVLGVDYAALEFPRRRVAPGLTYTVQASSDLVNWTTVGSCDVEDGSIKTIRDTLARSTLPRRFLRLQVSLVP